MPNPLQPPWAQIIPLLPVADHSVSVRAGAWQAHLARHGHQNLHQAVFAGNREVRLSRHRLLNFAYPNQQQKCLELFMWGWPLRNRGNLRAVFLRNLNAVSAAAPRKQPWPVYYASLHGIGGLGIATITKLAYFYGHHFGNLRSLILDSRMIGVLSGARWQGLAMPNINYNSAVADYPAYLQTISRVADRLRCASDQIELMLFLCGAGF